MIKAKNIALTAPLEVFINQKIGSILAVLKGQDIEVRVEVGRPSRHHNKVEVYYAEANVKIGSTLVRAESNHVDIRSAIVEVKDELKIQLKKFKEKRSDTERRIKK